MEQNIGSAHTALQDLLDALPTMPEVPGWIGIYGGSSASVHVDPRGEPGDFDAVVDALAPDLGDGHELRLSEAGYASALRQYRFAAPVAGWTLSVVTRTTS